MVMITGGAYQGKTACAVGNFGISQDEIISGRSCTPHEAMSAKCITDLQELLRRLGDGSVAFAQELCRRNSSAVIIMEEIGCGIVPMEKSERVWRENVGRCGCIIAASSETVVRMVCGIPTVIKGEMP